MLKAYVYYDNHEGYGYIYFAETAGKAKAEVANEHDENFIDVSVVREKAFDKYAEQGFVPVIGMLEAGWWHTCYGRTNCGAHIELEDLSNGARIVDNHAYCAECAKTLKAEV